MDLIIYGERKTALEAMPQAAADCFCCKTQDFKADFSTVFLEEKTVS